MSGAKPSQVSLQADTSADALRGLEAVAYRILRELMRPIPVEATASKESDVAVMLRRGVLRQAQDWEAEATLFELALSPAVAS